ncbi:hypothetical protein DY000_02053760 [Brassica cretica]|uniref:Uncharacterized protein n=1 Tax=Brassica cretica TaxID=69181 RepID=A0ABQ7AA90_BRACR|nr:hypothetical protein DY000_02053760 [Brassica cretica]
MEFQEGVAAQILGSQKPETRRELIGVDLCKVFFICYKIDAPLNERDGRVLMMVLLLHHNGAAKIRTSLQSDSCVLSHVVLNSDRAIYNTIASLKLSDYFFIDFLDEDEMLRKLWKFAKFGDQMGLNGKALGDRETKN